MFENIVNFFKRFGKNEKENSSVAAKERLHLVLAQDRANISADFLEMMKQEIIDVIKKYIDIDEEAIDVRMTNKPGEDGIVGAPALYANIPIVTIKNEARKLEGKISKEVITETNKQITIENESEQEESEVNKKEELEEVVKDQEEKKDNDIVVEENKQAENQKDNRNKKEEIKTNSEKKNEKEKSNSNTKNKKVKVKED